MRFVILLLAAGPSSCMYTPGQRVTWTFFDSDPQKSRMDEIIVLRRVLDWFWAGMSARWFEVGVPERVGILRNDHLGDVILTLPLVQAASQRPEFEEVQFLVNPAFVSLLERVELKCQMWGVVSHREWEELTVQLAGLDLDGLIVAASTTDNAWAAWSAGIRRRYGFGYKPSVVFHTDPLFVHRKEPYRHEAEFCLDYLRMMLGEDREIEAELPAYSETKHDQERARQVLADHDLVEENFWIVHPGHGGSAHHPSQTYYRELIEKLATKTTILVSGKGDERETNAELTANLDGVVNLQEDLKLEVFAAVLKRANGIIAGSTGPLHLASLVDTSRIGLYPNNPSQAPEKWAPLGDDQRIFTPKEDDGMDTIPLEDVIGALEELDGLASE